MGFRAGAQRDARGAVGARQRSVIAGTVGVLTACGSVFAGKGHATAARDRPVDPILEQCIVSSRIRVDWSIVVFLTIFFG